MCGHPHAELMAQYAEDAKTNPQPWKLWEANLPEDTHWNNLLSHPGWNHNVKYRRKPKTILINGFDVPEPCRVMPPKGTIFWSALNRQVTSDSVAGLHYEEEIMKNGCMHLTKEAAEIHREALISFTVPKP